jgi:cytochrome c-type biogenesis protein CcmH
MNALWLGGMAKAQQGDTVEAARLWKKLEVLLPAGSDSQKEVQDLLSKLAAESPQARTQPEAPQTAKVPDSKNSTASIKVEVSLSPGLQNKYQATDTVFIYAQAVSGPKIPLAIVRKQVSDLPLTVSLDDTLAMMPTMKLSNFSEVKLLARISKSGNAITQPDDLIGVIERVELSDKNTYKIVISEHNK